MATPSTKQTEVIIQEIIFLAPAPFAEGHVCSLIESSVLNQCLAENLRNNFTKVVKQAKEQAGERALSAEELSTLHAKFADYASRYTFQFKAGPKAPIDPIGRESAKIALVLVKEGLQRKGISIKDLPDGKLDEYVAKVANQESVIKEAKRRIDATRAVAAEALDL